MPLCSGAGERRLLISARYLRYIHPHSNAQLIDVVYLYSLQTSLKEV